MEKKYLYIIIIAIVVIIAIVGVYFSGIAINNEMRDSSNWETKELAGIKFKLPERYSGGMIMSGNVIDGVSTGNSYESNEGGLVINIYLSNENSSQRDEEYNSYMESNSTVEILNISNNEVTVAHNDSSPKPFSIAFFEVNGNQIIIKWEETTINSDIKAIIASFYELN